MSQELTAVNREDLKIGDPVTYWDWIDDDGVRHNPKETEIRSEAWQIGSGEWVISIVGKAGGVSIKHLTKGYLTI